MIVKVVPGDALATLANFIGVARDRRFDHGRNHHDNQRSVASEQASAQQAFHPGGLEQARVGRFVRQCVWPGDLDGSHVHWVRELMTAQIILSQPA